MADAEKLNVDSIISRLLEGKFRNHPLLRFHSEYGNVTPLLNVWLMLSYLQFEGLGLGRMFN